MSTSTLDTARLADELAAAVRRRHELDTLARTGEAVPLGAFLATETAIRRAEAHLLRARAADLA